MRKIILLFIVTMSILNSCKKDVNTFIVGINIEAAFNQDNVQIFIDGQEKIMQSYHSRNFGRLRY